MSKKDSDFINTGAKEAYELKDWLYRNSFSRKESNVTALKQIIVIHLKKGNTADNITWKELDAALQNHPEWFSTLDPLVSR